MYTSSQSPNQGYLHPYWDGTHYLYGLGEQPRTLTELAMSHLSAEIRSKNNWWNIYQDQEWQEKQLKQATESIWPIDAPCGRMEVILNPSQVQYVLDELEGYAKLRDVDAGCQVSCFERIWESDSLLASELLDLLSSELDILRNEQRFAPGSIAYDVVDPFLYPLIYSRTLVKDTKGDLEALKPPATAIQDSYTASNKFACIPSVFAVSTTDDARPTASCLSYINNIHSSHRNLYSYIERVVSASVPLLEHVLTDLHRNNPLPQRIPGSYKYTEWNEPEEPEHSDDDEGWLNYEREIRRWTLMRPLKLPDIPENGYPGGLEDRKHIVSLRGRKIKLIIRITDIRLQPGEEPYNGTPFHVEGMRNERVVACALHCIRQSNMKALSVDFRMPVCSPKHYVPGDEGATTRTWGLRDGASCTQRLGGKCLREGFSIAFPNIYQHRIGPSRLVDTTKPGFTTLMGLYLVDPDLDDSAVPSALTVPPQQKAWMKDAVEANLDIRIPGEIVETIIEMVDGVMTEKESYAFAKEMRKDRETFLNRHNQFWCCLPFDLWPGGAG